MSNSSKSRKLKKITGLVAWGFIAAAVLIMGAYGVLIEWKS